MQEREEEEMKMTLEHEYETEPRKISTEIIEFENPKFSPVIVIRVPLVFDFDAAVTIGANSTMYITQ